MEKLTILLIEDNPGDVRLIREMLEGAQGLEAHRVWRGGDGAAVGLEVAGTLSAGLERLDEGGIDLVLLDLGLPDSQGTATAEELLARAPDVPVVVLTCLDDEETGMEIVHMGAQDYLVKGETDPVLLYRTIRYAIERKRVEKLLRRSEEEFRTLINDVFDHSTVGVFILDAEFRVVWINSAIERYFGLQKENVIGRDKRQTIRERIQSIFEDPDGFASTVLATYDDNTYVEHFECHVLPGDGREERWLEHWSQPITRGPYSGGRVEHYYDITERKKAEKRLKFTQFTMDHAGDAIYWADDNGRFILVNDTACRLYGYSREELLKMSIMDISPAFPREHYQEVWAKIKEKGAMIFEDEATRKDGALVPIEVSVTLLNFEGQEYGCGFVRDITERKAAEEVLRESECRFRELFNNMSSGVAVYEVVDDGNDFVFIDFNLAGERIEGVKKEDIIGKRVTEAFPGVKEFGIFEVFQRVWRTGKMEYFPEEIYRDERLSSAWRENWVYKLPTGEIVAVYNDVTDRKVADERLKKSENELNAIASSAKDAIIELDSEGRAQFWNKAAEAIFGYSKEEAIGENVHDLIAPPEYRESVKKGMDHFKKTGEGKVIGVTTEIEGLKKDGTTFPVELTVSSFILNGEWRAVAVVRDITDRKAAQRALDLTNKKLQLLSGITRHDILNQITALAGYTDLLGEVLPDDVEMRKYIDRITKATSAIERQITFTRDYEHLGVNPSLWQCVGATAEQAAASGGCAAHGVHVSTGTGTLEVFADPMLGKVFHNLFDNAVRHGEHVTEISITCREEEGGSMVIAVEDNGVGIPAEMKERIFRHGFGRNTGFGLFLVQEVLAITGMSIRETGEEGKGACFEIIVPPGGWRMSNSEGM